MVIGWVAGLTTLGFVLGENAWIKTQLEWIILGLVLITTAPVAFKMFFSKKKPIPQVSELPVKITAWRKK